MPSRPSLAQILRASIELTPSDGVAVIVQLARSPQTGRPRPIRLDPGHVWLEPDGAVTLADGLVPKLAEFAALLDHLLASAGDDVPRGLRSIIERAAGHGDPASLPSLTAFAAALAPFQPLDPAATVRALVSTLVDAPTLVTGPPPVPPPLPVPAVAPVAGLASAAVENTAVAAPAAIPPDVPRQVWRPSRWQLGGVVAAALLASMIGGALARPGTAAPPPAPAAVEAPGAVAGARPAGADARGLARCSRCSAAAGTCGR